MCVSGTSSLVGTVTTSISGTLDGKMNARPECIVNRGALFLCYSSPPVGPCAALCRDLHGWVVETLGPYRRRPCRASIGQVWAGLRITGFGAVWARSEKKLSTGSKVKREKVRWVAMLPTSGSRRPAMPVVSRDSGLSRAQDKIGLLIPQFPESRVAIPINRCVTAKIQGLLINLKKKPPSAKRGLCPLGGR